MNKEARRDFVSGALSSAQREAELPTILVDNAVDKLQESRLSV
jgi:hypothetical protein